MGYVYPNNLMARRANTKDAIKGGLMMFVFFIVIIGLYFVSETAHSPYEGHGLNCRPVNGEISCDLQ